MFKLLIFAVVISSALSDAVIELGDSDFDSGVAEHDTVLVMFYAPWCGHCKKLKPEFELAAKSLISNDPPVALAKVDCTEAGKETCNRFSVRGYPTLKIFKGGEMSQEYNGPRESNGIVKYMAAQVGPASKELTAADFEKFLEKPEVAVVAFLKEGGSLKPVFEKVSDKLREKVRFGHTSDAALLEKHGEDVLVLFRPKHLKNTFEESSVKTDSTDRAEIEAFIKENYHGLVGHRTTDNVADFKAPLIVAYFNVDYVKNPKGTNYWRNRVMKVAKAFAGQGITFGVSQHNDFQHELEEYGRGFVSGDKPVVCARDAKNSKFVMEEDFSIDALQKFVEDFSAGKLEPYLKSEPVPASNDGPVTVAVSKNFDEVVTNNGKDTLIEFYAPWCGHCKKLAPVFDELGTKLKDEDVAIVKMDATANDVPSGYEVRGFPTLFFLPKDKKDKPQQYQDQCHMFDVTPTVLQGGRELDDFIKYLAKHASSELKGWDRAGKAKKTEL
ncbi:Protein disulfide-isomerase A3 [Amphibalanus amphitrite]|uniref:Protein disulfide-isomerase n=1 Tax=Amphibalanus amphitrite TaxID=1232801 RepID=A0A6A4VA87_AMPAM|nr:Protein disulfide-isomerase A3 [Amphibalanus amphitrite]